MTKFRLFVTDVISHIQSYKLFKLGDYITRFVEQLSSCYCKFGRNNIKGKNPEVWRETLATLGYILHSLSIVLYRIIPNTCSEINRNLKEMGYLDDGRSLSEYRLKDLVFIEEEGDKTQLIDIVFNHIHAVLTYRASVNISGKHPINKVIFGLQNSEICLLDQIKRYAGLIETEANVFEISYINISEYVIPRVRPNFKTIGLSFRNNMKQITSFLQNEHENKTVAQYIKKDKFCYVNISGETFHITQEHIELYNQYKPIDGYKLYSDGDITVFIDDRDTPEAQMTFLTRYFASRIQQYRKEINIRVTDAIDIRYSGSKKMLELFETKRDYIYSITERTLTELDNNDTDFLANLHADPKTYTMGDETMTIYLRKL